jgi:hypothetical protein
MFSGGYEGKELLKLISQLFEHVSRINGIDYLTYKRQE